MLHRTFCTFPSPKEIRLSLFLADSATLFSRFILDFGTLRPVRFDLAHLVQLVATFAALISPPEAMMAVQCTCGPRCVKVTQFSVSLAKERWLKLGILKSVSKGKFPVRVDWLMDFYAGGWLQWCYEFCNTLISKEI